MATTNDEVVTTYTLQDQYTDRLQQMSASTQQFDRQVQQAQRSIQQTQSGGGGFFGAFMTGGASGVIARLGVIGAAIGAVSLGLGKFRDILGSLNDKLLSIGSEGGPLAQLLTLPGRLVIEFNTIVAKLFDSIKSFGLFPIFEIISSITDLPLAVTNAMIGLLARGFETLASVMGQVAKIVSEIGGQMLGAFAAIAGKALEIATEFDSLKRSFGALLESPAQGDALARFIRQYGMTSPFEQQPLFEAARAIVAAGQSFSRFAPLMERIALLRGGGSENLRDVASLFTMLFGGATGRVFGPMGLGRFGIGRTQLQEAGAQFTKSGEFIGGVEEAIAVLERLLSQPRFANLSEMFEEGPAVVFSNALDGVNKLLEQIGSTIASVVVPYVKIFGETLSDIAESAAVRDFLQGFKSAFTIEGGAERFRAFILDVAAVMLSLPEILSRSWGIVVDGAKMFWTFVTGMWDTMADMVNTQIDAFNKLVAMAEKIAGRVERLAQNIKFIVERLAPISNLFPDGAEQKSGRIPHLPKTHEIADLLKTGLGNAENMVGNAMEGIGDVISRNRAGLDTLVGGNVEDPTKDARKSLGSIASSTAETAANTRQLLDLSRTALGGGDIGRFGIMPIEGRAVRSGSVRVDIRGAQDALSTAIQQIVEGILVDYERQMARVGAGRA